MHDLLVERSLVTRSRQVAYAAALRAPSKRVVWFEESGHEPFMDEPAGFNRSVSELVRQLLSGSPARGS
jgi:pimeloyl-ACP methyl ester carboxylesterase